jgi:hypothetical protein
LLKHHRHRFAKIGVIFDQNQIGSEFPWRWM